MAFPRTDNIYQALNIFKYLEVHINNKLAFDPLFHEVREKQQTRTNIEEMKKVYKDETEELPNNALIPLGTTFQVNCFVDSDHAVDRLTRCSQSGILLFCNSAPIYWYPKKQNTVEASTYGAELVALRLAAELVVSLRYKLRMFGIPVDGISKIFCDNESVYRNVSFAE